MRRILVAAIAAVLVGPFLFPAVALADPPQDDKTSVRAQLTNLVGVGSAATDERLIKAIAHLDKALDPALWVDDSTLDPKHGDQVFKEEEEAVKDLIKIEDLDVTAQIATLVTADETLAQTAIDNAIAAGASDVTKAVGEMAKAAEDVADDKPDKAISHYKKAWGQVLKAKVEVCHLGGDGTFKVKDVSVKDVPSHQAHGDLVVGVDADENCNPVVAEIIFAVAYTDVVDDGGGYNPDVDVLIAKLVDGNSNGYTDAGDLIIMGQYPLDVGAMGFGTFDVTQHTSDNVGSISTTQVLASVGANTFTWADTPLVEGYLEQGSDPLDQAQFLDGLVSPGGGLDTAIARSGAPSEPDTPIPFDSLTRSGDQPFVDVELNFVAAP